MSELNNNVVVKDFRIFKRGDVFYVDLGSEGLMGSEQRNIRPCVLVSNDIGNKHSPCVTVCPITSHINKAKLPTHVTLLAKESCLDKDSVVLTEQIRTISKQRICKDGFVCHLSDEILHNIDKAIIISLGIDVSENNNNNSNNNNKQLAMV